MRAGDDTLARRLLDERLAEVGAVPAARSLVLVSAVSLLTDLALVQDSARRRRNFDVAATYAQQLSALPASGYATQADGINVQQRKSDAQLMMLRAAVMLQASDRIASQIVSFAATVVRYPLPVRQSFIHQFPYGEIGGTILNLPGGRNILDSLDATLLRLVVPRATEWPVTLSATERAAVRTREQQAIQTQVLNAFGLIGRRAPSVTGHAWLNTSDSLYAPQPRTHSLDDGVIRVIAVHDSRLNEVIPALERVQQRFADGDARRIQVVYVTKTEGHIGPDVATPQDEVEWLRSFYRDVRHVTFPIAIWAGTLPPNTYGWRQLAPSLNEDSFRTGQLLGGCCVIVDGHGIVRWYQTVETRAQERQLINRLMTLRDQAAP